MKIVLAGFLILFVTAVTIVTIINIFDSMITSACEKERLDQMSQYCYERLIKTN
jgi:hypothetical protein